MLFAAQHARRRRLGSATSPPVAMRQLGSRTAAWSEATSRRQAEWSGLEATLGSALVLHFQPVEQARTTSSRYPAPLRFGVPRAPSRAACLFVSSCAPSAPPRVAPTPLRRFLPAGTSREQRSCPARAWNARRNVTIQGTARVRDEAPPPPRPRSFRGFGKLFQPVSGCLSAPAQRRRPDQPPEPCPDILNEEPLVVVEWRGRGALPPHVRPEGESALRSRLSLTERFCGGIGSECLQQSSPG